MRANLLLVLVVACGGAAEPRPVATRVALPSAEPSTVATAKPTVAPPPGAHLRGTIPIPTGDDPVGPAFAKDGTSVVFAAGGKLLRFDVATLAAIDARPVTKVARLVGTALVLHGSSDAAFDVSTASRVVVDVPKGYDCKGDSFSADASKVARNCVTKTDECVLVQDTRTGALIAKLAEFQTAAPVRSGTITDSGNFVFWASRASGAFEEISSKVTGPVMSSHSTMAPDERALFTVTDKDWMPDDRTPARMLDPKTGHAKYTLPWDVDRVFFSPDGSRFAALHVKGDAHEVSSVTVHRTDDGAVAATLPETGVVLVAFSPDGHALVLRDATSVKLHLDLP